MKYIMISSNKMKYVLDEEQKEAVFKAIDSGRKQVVIDGEMIPVNISPEIVKFERWYAQENQRLALTHHRLCKNCLSVMMIEDKCSCWQEQGLGKDKNAFQEPNLPESVKGALDQIAKKKEFPELDNWDKGMVATENLKLNKPITGEGFYQDPETKEIFYT